MGFLAYTKTFAQWLINGAVPLMSEARQWGLEVETALDALMSRNIVNGKIVVSVAANSLTVTLQTLAGATPSAADPVYFIARDATAGSGGQGRIKIAAAASLTVSAGSTLGWAAGETLRLLLLGFIDGSTFRFGVFNPAAGGVRYPLPDHGLASVTNEGGAGAADSAGVVYSDATVTTKAFAVLGTLSWLNGLASAGLWSAGPDYVKPWSADDVAPAAAFGAQIYGLTLANNAGDAANDIDISPGWCDADGFAGKIALTAALTKRSDATWAVGSGNGGWDTGGAKANDSWGYVWLIGRSDTGVVDALFSASATAPTMPSNYDKKRRIGAVRFGATTAPILAFKQDGDVFTWDVPVQDDNATNPGTAARTPTLKVPPSSGSVSFTAILNFILINGTTAAIQALVTETAQTNTAPSTSVADARTTLINGNVNMEMRRKVDASSQIRTRLSASGASDVQQINTRGYVDTRGK